MKQDSSQKFLLWGISIILAIVVLGYLRKQKITNEAYMPFRRTGGCPPRTGFSYLDAYEQQDYYRKHPWIYPTPVSYTTAWYNNRRKLNESLDKDWMKTYIKTLANN